MEPEESKRCEKCGNHHQSICASEVTDFYWPYPAKEVFLIGQWSQWQSKEPMHRANNIFLHQANLRVGVYKYKFIVDGVWSFDPHQLHEPDSYGSYNNVMEVYPKTLYQNGNDIENDKVSNEKILKLTTQLVGNEVKVTGSWDNWATERLMHKKHNALKNCDQSYIEIILQNGRAYEYKFKVNGDYVIDETAPTIRNSFGTLNNRMIFRWNPIHDSPANNNSIKQASQGGKEIEPKKWKWEKITMDQFRDNIFGHTMCNLGQDIFIFGGKRRSTVTSDLIKLKKNDLTSVQIQRISIEPRAFHSSVAYGTKLIIFGGCSQQEILSDYNVYVTQTNQWPVSAVIRGRPSHKREKGSCVLYKQLLVFFGGYYWSADLELQTFFNDIEVLDIENMVWNPKPHIKGKEPTPRFSHTANLYGDNMIVFGGQYESQRNLNLNDVWQINLDTCGDSLSWEELKIAGIPPAPRHGHTSNIIQHYMVIFGGVGDDNKTFNDVKILDLKRLQWIHPTIDGDKPKPRQYHATCTIDHSEIIMFGGKTSSHRNQNIYVLRPMQVGEILEFADDS